MYQLFPVDRQEEALTGYFLKGQMVTIVSKIPKVNGRLKQKIFFNISVMCLPSIYLSRIWWLLPHLRKQLGACCHTRKLASG